MSLPSADPPATPASWGSAMLGAFLGALSSPSTWPVALAGFLARGGLFLFIVPIVVLPTPAGVNNVVAPWVVPFAFGLVSVEVVVILASITAAIIGWIVAGGLVGAWADAIVVRAAAADEELGAGGPGLGPGPGVPDQPDGRSGRLLAVRLIAHAPLAVALIWGAGRIGEAGYRELTSPLEVVSPLLVRVVSAVPDAVALVLVAWIVGEAAGGLAIRHVVLGGASVGQALRDGYLDLIDGSALATLGLTTLGLVVTLAPSVVAASVGWTWARLMLLGGALGPVTAAAIVLFVLLWLGGLVLAAVVAAWRSYAWTAEWLRGRAGLWGADAPSEHEVGTIGDAGSPRPGGWSSSGSSGTV